ncbi:hypothetical protein GCM10023258_05330 [Terrabacter aeriphilus]|uniref:Uncharacterized protein n=1 Tax=Terrabacter aeriphilus TaxID=515662 RepID=A0ABP9J438_9MICO
MEPRSVRPYLIALGLLWVVPAVLVLVLHVVLPDHNASGQCSGIGFGCTLTPADAVLFFGYLGALPLFLLGLLACLVIAIVQSRRQRRADADADADAGAGAATSAGAEHPDA